MESTVLSINDVNSFFTNLNIQLSKYAYYPDTVLNNQVTYKCKNILQFNFLLYKISVQIRDNNAFITGPKAYINKIKKENSHL